jgi:hypothetical protein
MYVWYHYCTPAQVDYEFVECFFQVLIDQTSHVRQVSI